MQIPHIFIMFYYWNNFNCCYTCYKTYIHSSPELADIWLLDWKYIWFWY